MNLYVQQDINDLLDSEQILFKQLQKKTVFITGATGLIGSNLVLALLEANKKFNLDITVLALVRNQEKAEQMFIDYISDEQLKFIVGDVLHIPDIAQPIDFIIHGASITASSDFVNKPVDTIHTALQGTMNVLELAKNKQVNSFVYLSSLEIYGVANKKDIFEEDIGYIDFTNVRSSYSESKRMAECLSVSYAKQYGIPVKIARLGQTFGPGVSYFDNRVFAQFARSVIEQKDIVLHTTGETERNYCYTKDAVSAILYILLKGENSQAYNVANEATMISIRDMAEMVAKLNVNGQTKVVVDLKDSQALGFNPIVKIRLKTEKLEKLGWKATIDLEQMFVNLIKFMRTVES